jgi:hypothetical protein
MTSSIQKFNLYNLPKEILIIIFEFEGLNKIIHDKFLKEFKKILDIERHYRLAYRASYYNDDFYVRAVKGLKVKEKYKFILNCKNRVSFCSCLKPCCYRFQYNNDTEKYICGCHAKNTCGVSYSYSIGQRQKQKITVRTEKTGFCVKIL